MKRVWELWEECEKKLKFNVTNTSQAAKSLIAATIGFKYSVKLKITFDQGNMKVYMGGAVFELTESGDFEFDLIRFLIRDCYEPYHKR